MPKYKYKLRFNNHPFRLNPATNLFQSAINTGESKLEVVPGDLNLEVKHVDMGVVYASGVIVREIEITGAEDLDDVIPIGVSLDSTWIDLDDSNMSVQIINNMCRHIVPGTCHRSNSGGIYVEFIDEDDDTGYSFEVRAGRLGFGRLKRNVKKYVNNPASGIGWLFDNEIIEQTIYSPRVWKLDK